jgi:hypothetical protein
LESKLANEKFTSTYPENGTEKCVKNGGVCRLERIKGECEYRQK